MGCLRSSFIIQNSLLLESLAPILVSFTAVNNNFYRTVAKNKPLNWERCMCMCVCVYSLSISYHPKCDCPTCSVFLISFLDYTLHEIRFQSIRNAQFDWQSVDSIIKSMIAWFWNFLCRKMAFCRISNKFSSISLPDEMSFVPTSWACFIWLQWITHSHSFYWILTASKYIDTKAIYYSQPYGWKLCNSHRKFGFLLWNL